MKLSMPRRGGIPRSDRVPPAAGPTPPELPTPIFNAKYTVAPLDPDYVAQCVGLYEALSVEARKAIVLEFAGRPRSVQTDREWCEAVERAYYGHERSPASGLANEPYAVMTAARRAEAVRTPSAGRIDTTLSGPACILYGGTPTTGGCNIPDTTPTPAPGASHAPVRSADDCRSQGGFVMGFGGGPQSCSFVGGANVPIGPAGDAPGPDNTQQIVQGVVGGVLGIAQVVGQVIGRQDAQEFQRFMAGLQQEQVRAEQASRSGDREAALALARIQQAIAESTAAAATANAEAQRLGQRPPFPEETPTPTWVYVAGGAVALALTAAVVVALTRPQQPQQFAPQAR